MYTHDTMMHNLKDLDRQETRPYVHSGEHWLVLNSWGGGGFSNKLRYYIKKTQFFIQGRGDFFTKLVISTQSCSFKSSPISVTILIFKFDIIILVLNSLKLDYLITLIHLFFSSDLKIASRTRILFFASSNPKSILFLFKILSEKFVT